MLGGKKEKERREVLALITRLKKEEERKKQAELNEVLITGLREEEEERKKQAELKKDKWVKHYCSCHKILLVGEGDFSFSLCLAKAFGSASNMVATSLDSAGQLMRKYKKAISNISELEKNGCKVIHGVDATTMMDHFMLRGLKFDRIIFNFPQAGFSLDHSRQTKCIPTKQNRASNTNI